MGDFRFLFSDCTDWQRPRLAVFSVRPRYPGVQFEILPLLPAICVLLTRGRDKPATAIAAGCVALRGHIAAHKDRYFSALDTCRNILFPNVSLSCVRQVPQGASLERHLVGTWLLQMRDDRLPRRQPAPGVLRGPPTPGVSPCRWLIVANHARRPGSTAAVFFGCSFEGRTSCLLRRLLRVLPSPRLTAMTIVLLQSCLLR